MLEGTGTTFVLYQDVVLLHHNILRAFRESKGLPWPLKVNDMKLSFEKLLLPDLLQFLSMVMAGKEDVETSEKMKCGILHRARPVPCSV